MKEAVRETWEEHWTRLGSPASFVGRLASVVRRSILRRAVLAFDERYLPRKGILVELGCGTAGSSRGMAGGERRLVALDLSMVALRAAASTGVFGSFVLGDLERLPFRSGALDGAWNLGVLEHFEEERGRRVLGEIRRVMKPGGVAVLFWPPEFGSARIALAPIEALRTRLSGRPFAFFPDEANRLRSKGHARRMLAAAGLEPLRVAFSLRAAFIHLVVVARRPAS